MTKQTKAEIIADRSKGKRAPTGKEVSAIAAAREARKLRPARAQFAQHPDTTDKQLNLDCPHSDAEGQPFLVAETFGTTSDDFVTNAILHLSNVTVHNGAPSIEGLNATLAIVGAIAPENELEAALAAQMAATHELSMDLLRRTKQASTRDAMRDYGNLATKLSRTFTAQMKTLSDWRRGGEQVVRHLHVYEGGQAVVAGTINQGGREYEIEANKAHEQGACSTALLGQDTARNGLPVSSNPRTQQMQTSRRPKSGRRRSEG